MPNKNASEVRPYPLRDDFGWRLRPWIAALIVLFVMNSGLSFYNNHRSVSDSEQVIHTHEVLAEIEAVWHTVLGAESGQRAFLISEDPKYLAELEGAPAETSAHLEKIERMTVDNAEQQARLPALRERVAARLREMVLVRDLRNEQGLDAARARLESGRTLMTELAEQCSTMRATELRLLDLRLSSSARSYTIGSLSSVVEAIVGLCVLFLFSRTLKRHLRARIRSEGQLFIERDQFRTTLASIGDAVITTDTMGRVVFLNSVASELSGYSQEEARGKALEQVFVIVNEDTRAAVASPAHRALREGAIVGLANHTILIAKDGKERNIDDSAAPIRTENGEITGAVLVFRDVSVRRRAEQDQLESNRVLQLRIAIGELIEGDLDIETVLKGCTDAFVRLVGAEFSRIWLIDANETHLQLRASSGTNVDLVSDDKEIRIGKSRFGEIAATRVPYWTNEVRADAEFANRDWSSSDLVQAIAGYPLVIDDRTLGVLGVYSNRKLSQELFDELGLIADSIAQFIERKRVDDLRRRLAALVENSHDAIHVFGDDGNIAFLNRASRARFLRDDAEPGSKVAIRDLFLEEDHHQFEKEFLPKVLADGHGQVELRMRTNETPCDTASGPTKATWMNCHAFVVVDSKGNRSGVAMVCRDVSERRKAEQFLKESQEQYRTLAAEFHAANLKLQQEMEDRALVNAALQRRSSQLQAITEIATRLNVIHDVPSVLNMITDGARRIIDAQASISITSTGDRLQEPLIIASLSDRYATWRGQGQRLVNARVHETVRDSKRPIRISRDELTTNPRWQSGNSQEPPAPPLTDVIAVPITGFGGGIVGALHVVDKTAGHFTPEDETIVVQLALMGSVAIENARLYAELVDADRRKDEFLATLAHELRNPLAPIRNGLQILQLSSGDPSKLDSVKGMMERQIGMMIRLVDDLLDVSRITRGKIQLQLERLDLAHVVRDAVETSRPIIDSARHNLTVDLPKDPIYLLADRVRLAQVVANLLNNAAKFTPDGGNIHLMSAASEAEIVIRVRDNGVGIPRDMLPRIFDLFTQVDRTLKLTKAGIGIGLALVKRLVELHGGTVEAHSDGPGRGSELVIRLPPSRLASEVGAAHDGDGTPARPVERSLRVLVVDDHKDSADSLGILIGLMGNAVRICCNAREAIEVAKEFLPEVFLLDIGLPDMNGYELAMALRAMPEFKDALFIAQTGWGQETDRRRSSESGFNTHLVKPIDVELLKNLLRGL